MREFTAMGDFDRLRMEKATVLACHPNATGRQWSIFPQMEFATLCSVERYEAVFVYANGQGVERLDFCHGIVIDARRTAMARGARPCEGVCK